jgi:hypothetical protein
LGSGASISSLFIFYAVINPATDIWRGDAVSNRQVVHHNINIIVVALLCASLDPHEKIV